MPPCIRLIKGVLLYLFIHLNMLGATYRINRSKRPYKSIYWGFPGGTVVESPPANAGNTGLSPGLGRSHMPRGN